MKYIVKVGADKYEIEAPTKYDAKVAGVRSHIKKYPAQFHTPNDVMSRFNVEVQEAGQSS